MRLLFLAIAVSLASQTQHPETSAPLSPETLEFHWPGGIVANVDTEFVSDATVDDAHQVIALLRMTHQMRVVEKGDLRFVQQTNHNRVESSGYVLAALQALLPLWVQALVVTDRGQLRSIEGADEARRLVNEVLGRNPLVARIPQAKEALQYFASDEGTQALAEIEWRDIVGRWIGLSVTDATKDGSGAAPIIPGITVPTKVTVAMVGRSTCQRGKEARECATFEYREAIDRAGIDAAIKSVMEGATIAPPPMDYEGWELVLRVTLETKTMLPHEFTNTRTVRGTAKRGDRSAQIVQVDRRRSQFSYVD